ncbi:hypothetical protein E2C01_098642 [Portunus trituberculatus]|uniref:Uncharacterized protein n=1 Tax=Portunus trituberculatus TaxID=210409 RepID=A0A5B7K8X6_PORTR|nr:hypothetical protein [Portunus trituberculatus]
MRNSRNMNDLNPRSKIPVKQNTTDLQLALKKPQQLPLEPFGRCQDRTLTTACSRHTCTNTTPPPLGTGTLADMWAIPGKFWLSIESKCGKSESQCGIIFNRTLR